MGGDLRGNASCAQSGQKTSGASGGYLAYSVWQFERFERFQKKLIPWQELLRQTKMKIDLEELEPGDHLMRWGEGEPAYRYCHALAEAESDALVRLLTSQGLNLIAEFEAEGRTDELNRYFLFRRA